MATARRPRHLLGAELPLAVDVLTEAFLDDPMFCWVFADPARRPAALRSWMEAIAERGFACGHAHVVGDAAVAMWAPPDRPFFDDATVGRIGEVVGAAEGERAEQVFGELGALGDLHPEEPHFYLHVIGTTRAARGAGLGGALLRHVLDVCDAERLGAHLESSNPANVPLYERYGFRVQHAVALDGGTGPVLHTMWRDPPG